MNYGIGNVKGKSSGGGGGGIPVITLQASQMISQTQIQFTQDQYNTIVANGCFYLDLLGSQQLLMTCVNASNLADIQCYNISQTGSGLQLATIDLNKSTYIGVLGISPYPQAKQLYQHNVSFVYSYNNDKVRLGFTIISDVPTEFDKNDFATWLTNAGYDGLNKIIMPSGYVYSTSLYGVNGFGFISSSQNFIVNYYLGSTSTNQQWALSSTNYTITDNVVAL